MCARISAGNPMRPRSPAIERNCSTATPMTIDGTARGERRKACIALRPGNRYRAIANAPMPPSSDDAIDTASAMIRLSRSGGSHSDVRTSRYQRSDRLVGGRSR